MLIIELALLGLFGLDVFFHCVGYGYLYFSPLVSLELLLISINIEIIVAIFHAEEKNFLGIKLLASVCLIVMRFDWICKKITDL